MLGGFYSQLTTNESAEGIFDLGVAGDRRGTPGPRVGVYVVTSTGAFEIAPGRDELADELPPLHAATRMGFVWARLRGDSCSFIMSV